MKGKAGRVYSLTPKGEKFFKLLKKHLDELEQELTCPFYKDKMCHLNSGSFVVPCIMETPNSELCSKYLTYYPKKE